MKPDISKGLIARLWQTFVKIRRFLWHLLYQKEVDIVGFKDLSQPARIEVSDEVTIEAFDSNNEKELRNFAYTHLQNYPDAIKRFEDCIARGFFGMIARHHGVLIGYGWWVNDKMLHPQVEALSLPIGSGDVYGFDVFIGQEFRGRHAGLQSMVASARYFQALGYSRFISIIRTDNIRSLRVHSQWGWQEFERRTVFTIATCLIYCHGRLRWRNRVWF